MLRSVPLLHRIVLMDPWAAISRALHSLEERTVLVWWLDGAYKIMECEVYETHWLDWCFPRTGCDLHYYFSRFSLSIYALLFDCQGHFYLSFSLWLLLHFKKLLLKNCLLQESCLRHVVWNLYDFPLWNGKEYILKNFGNLTILVTTDFHWLKKNTEIEERKRKSCNVIVSKWQNFNCLSELSL